MFYENQIFIIEQLRKSRVVFIVFCGKYSFDMQEPSPYTYTNSKSKRYFCWQRRWLPKT
jgi:hypothetical protein